MFPTTDWIGGWLCPIAGLHTEVKEESFAHYISDCVISYFSCIFRRSVKYTADVSFITEKLILFHYHSTESPKLFLQGRFNN